MTAPKRILVTRPRQEAKRTAARLAEHGFQAVIAPISRIVPLEPTQPTQDWAGAILTSANAAGALRHLSLGGRPVFAVGAKTALAAREAGASVVHEADGDAAALAELVRQSLPKGTALLHLAGRQRKDEPALSLRGAGYELEVIDAYDALAEAELPDVAREAIAAKKLAAAVHFSRRSVEILMALAEKAGLADEFAGLPHICLSNDVAAPLREIDAARIAVAERPHEASLLAALSAALGAP